MQAPNDHELLRLYAHEKSEPAFAALVSRYVKLVYSAALRQVADPHLAHDVTQSVFVLLARKAKSLPQNIILSGWLYRAAGYVASDARRSESRRRKREEIAMQNFSETPTDSSWNEISTILDDAMRELGKQDREFVLLRYFENRSLREIGNVMGVSDDAAQKRVSRALERLRELLGQRGSKVSAAALGSALLNYSCSAAPASVITVTAATASAIGITAFSKLTIEFMAMTKIKLAAVVVAAGAAVAAPVVSQQNTIRELRAENQRLVARVAEAPPATETGVAQISQPEIERLRAEAAEVHRLRAEVAALSKGQSVRSLRASRGGVAPTPIDEETAADPQKRMYFADELVKQGKFAEALDHYLWCYDNGAKAPGFYGVRGSFLLGRIKELGSRFPEARQALAERRDALEAAIIADQASKTGFDPLRVNELIGLNDNLDEPNRNLALFDQLPDTHPARTALANHATEQFIKANRYLDVVNAGTPEENFERAVANDAAFKKTGLGDGSRADYTRRRIIETGGRALEALAGAGEIERARILADKILKYDSSPETKAELLKYAQRAGSGAIVEQIRAAR